MQWPPSFSCRTPMAHPTVLAGKLILARVFYSYEPQDLGILARHFSRKDLKAWTNIHDLNLPVNKWSVQLRHVYDQYGLAVKIRLNKYKGWYYCLLPWITAFRRGLDARIRSNQGVACVQRLGTSLENNIPKKSHNWKKNRSSGILGGPGMEILFRLIWPNATDKRWKVHFLKSPKRD